MAPPNGSRASCPIPALRHRFTQRDGLPFADVRPAERALRDAGAGGGHHPDRPVRVGSGLGRLVPGAVAGRTGPAERDGDAEDGRATVPVAGDGAGGNCGLTCWRAT